MRGVLSSAHGILFCVRRLLVGIPIVVICRAVAKKFAVWFLVKVVFRGSRIKASDHDWFYKQGPGSSHVGGVVVQEHSNGVNNSSSNYDETEAGSLKLQQQQHEQNDREYSAKQRKKPESNPSASSTSSSSSGSLKHHHHQQQQQKQKLQQRELQPIGFNQNTPIRMITYAAVGWVSTELVFDVFNYLGI